MKRLYRLALVMTLSGVFVPAAFAQDLRAEIENIVQDYLRKNPQEVQKIVRDYLSANPDVVQQILADALKKQRGAPPSPVAAAPAAPAGRDSAAVRENAAAIFKSVHQGVIGNRDGDVTLVEFFDYNCGFCKRSLADKLVLMETDPNLRIVLKDLPILGPNSVEAARVAIAVRMQDQDGRRYLEFHKRLLSERLPPNKERAFAVARDVGFDMARIESDYASDEVDVSIAEASRLARSLGINGTPSYVVGEKVVIGAVGATALKETIRVVRASPK